MIRRRALLSVVLNTQPIDISKYLTIEALSDGLTASLSVNDCEYCIDGDGVWKTLTADTVTETVNTGQTLSFRGNLTPDSTNGIGTFTISKKCSVKGNVMSLLFGDNGYKEFDLTGYDYAFYKLFYGQRTVIDASNLILPAQTLSLRCYSMMFQNTYITKTPYLPAETLHQHCYSYMFYECTKLTAVTNLPATILAPQCYSYMFYNCTSLVKSVDILPAMTLKNQCYHNMFRNCTSLTTPPILPALYLESNCYHAMFSGCSKLNYINAQFLTTPSSTTTSSWVSNIASTGTFVKNPDATWDVVGSNGIPEGWIVQFDEVPGYNSNYMTIESLEDGLTIEFYDESSSGTLEYTIDYGKNWIIYNTTNSPVINRNQMISFKGNLSSNMSIGQFTISKRFNLKGNCMSLIYGDDAKNRDEVPQYAFQYLFSRCSVVNVEQNFLPATTLASNCYQYMFDGCSSLTQAPELPATTLAEDCYHSMFLSCSRLTTAPELPATTLASSCYYYMFGGCTSLVTPPELPATTLTEDCYWNMFHYCRSLTTAPELPATTLAYGCYRGMFQGCSKLNYIKMLATDISASYCLSNWVVGVSSIGTFVKNPSMTTLPSGTSGIPSGWTVVNNDTVNLITFTVDDIGCQAEEGMTWEDYIDSEYNTIGAFIQYNEKISISAQSPYIYDYTINDINGVNNTDIIQNYHEYYSYYIGGGGTGN